MSTALILLTIWIVGVFVTPVVLGLVTDPPPEYSWEWQVRNTLWVLLWPLTALSFIITLFTVTTWVARDKI